jgi:hypothetical protein
MSKPTLHEIAAMPFPASMLAMREHYNSEWGRPIPDGGELIKYKVTVNYSVRVRDSRTYTVEAYCEQDAERLSSELFDKDRTVEDDVDVEDLEIEEAQDA